MRKLFFLFLILGVFVLCVYAATISSSVSARFLMEGVMQNYLKTGATNAVAAVYLDFRIFDTLFETFLLLVSVMGLSQFLRLESTEQIHMESEIDDNYKPSQIAASALRYVLPMLFIFGISMSIFGASSPGGGFQGGAILATIVMVGYLTKQKMRFSFDFYSAAEKSLYIVFLLMVGIYFLFYRTFSPLLRIVYFALCNLLICFKVNLGFIVIFLRLIGQSEHRTKGKSL